MGAGLLGDLRDPLLRPARSPRGLRPAARRGGSPARHLVLALGAAAALALQAAPASADTVDRATYAARLAEARTLLVAARAAAPAAREAAVEQARELLSRTTAVRLGDGRTAAVDESALAGRLATSDAALESAIADLGALGALASRGPAIDPASADGRLRQLVGEQRALGGQMTVIDLVSRWLARSLAGFGGAPPDPRVLVIGAGGIGLALLVVVLGILGRDLRERFRRETLLPQVVAERAVDPAEHLRAADEAIRGGRARDAIASLYAYALAALAARELVRYDPSLTDREVLARARTIPHADALRDLVELHERVSYGLRAVERDDAERARSLALRAVA